MRRLLTVMALLACGLASAKSYTADECRAKGNVGQKIKLQIAYLEGRSDGGRGVLKGYVVMQACTYDKDEFGGWIDVAIPEKNVQYYLNRARTKIRYIKDSTLVNLYKATGIIRMSKGKVMYVELTPPGSVR